VKNSSTAIACHLFGIAACDHFQSKILAPPGCFHIIAAASCQVAAANHFMSEFTPMGQQEEADDVGYLEWLQA
jgi:hypothetical protein